MSEQMTDPFLWQGREFVFLEASDVDELFLPENHGLEPEAPHTGCWKGFVVQFSLRDGQLFLDTLWVNDKNKRYPRINGKKARLCWREREFHVYPRLNLKLDYTGSVLVGRGRLEDAEERAFVGAAFYEDVWKLTFSHGKLMKYMREPIPHDYF